jgi:5-methylcytosine-specific restriction protein A
MSTNRVKPLSEKPSIAKLPKGPNGRSLCRQCGTEVPKGRRSFCGDTCIEQWRIRTDPSYVRALVFERDRGVCALCGLNTATLQRRRPKTVRTMRDYEAHLAYCEEIRALGYTGSFLGRKGGNRSMWDADHIVPVSEGGGECDLDNFRTLCVPCHKRATAELASRRAQRRRDEARVADSDGG